MLPSDRPHGKECAIEAFVGRDHQLTSLDAACTGSGGGVVLVEGPAGIGKTRLLAEFARRCATRRVVTVAATEFEQGAPLGLVEDLLERLDGPVGGIAHGPSATGERAEPRWESPLAPAPFARDGDPRAIARMVRGRLETEPTVLIVDDVHWADSASLRVLAALIRQQESASARLVLAYREGQFPAALGPALRSGGRAAAHLVVPPLSDADTAELLPDLGVVRRRRLLIASHGNPLYLQLLADHSPAELDAIAHEADSVDLAAEPAALDRTIRAELTQLPEAERRAIQAAAVCGPTSDIELLCATAESDRHTVTAAIDELVRRGWLTLGDRRITFRHPLIRTAAYGLTGPAARAEAHRRAADFLRTAGAPLLDRARHLEHSLCGRDDLAAAELLQAAEQTLATVPATSARWAAAALRAAADPPESSDGAAQLLLGRALLLSGSAADAREILEALATRAGPNQLEAILLQARCERVLGRADRARALLAAVAAPLIGPTQVIAGRPDGCSEPLAEQHISRDRADSGSSPESSTGALSRPPGNSEAPAVLHAEAPITNPQERFLAARPQRSDWGETTEILGAEDDSAVAAAVAFGAHSAGVHLELAILEMQDNREAEGAARVAALFESGAVRDPAIRAAATTLRSMGLLTGGDIAGAQAEYRVAEREFGRLSETELLDAVHAAAALGWMSYFLDDQRTGVAHIERAVRVSRRRGCNFILPELLTVQAYSLAKLGRFAEALAAAEDAAETAELFGYHDIPPLAGALELRVLAHTAPREALLERWRAIDAMPRPVMRWWRGVVEAALDEYADKTGCEAPNPIGAQPDTQHPMRPTELAVRAREAIAQGRIEEASGLVERAEDAARGSGLPAQLAAAAHARAEYAAARGDFDLALAAARTAIDAYGVADMPVQRAQALLLAAQLSGQQGDFGLATARIAAARAELIAAGAHELLTEATAAQRRLAGRRSVSGDAALTEREREVAELAARGFSNKDIAGRLFLSPRTVEDHLGRILRKLGLTGRAGIAHRLAELESGAREHNGGTAS
ncbi:helix-turn-helix transcriptional regulator [Nocardia yamanashiensis]|uniref:helix-turn-helix transcriptional regulator n=1 Tax=Nocardia yamanashiensis TaxID=209247 RepID=UPI00082F2BCF|nr:LuxR family transcriptional regulator [Nocardia yamanashiensis]